MSRPYFLLEFHSLIFFIFSTFYFFFRPFSSPSFGPLVSISSHSLFFPSCAHCFSSAFPFFFFLFLLRSLLFSSLFSLVRSLCSNLYCYFFFHFLPTHMNALYVLSVLHRHRCFFLSLFFSSLIWMQRARPPLLRRGIVMFLRLAHTPTRHLPPSPCSGHRFKRITILELLVETIKNQ